MPRTRKYFPNDNGLFSCPHCMQEFPQTSGVSRHVKKQHPTPTITIETTPLRRAPIIENVEDEQEEIILWIGYDNVNAIKQALQNGLKPKAIKVVETLIEEVVENLVNIEQVVEHVDKVNHVEIVPEVVEHVEEVEEIELVEVDVDCKHRFDACLQELPKLDDYRTSDLHRMLEHGEDDMREIIGIERSWIDSHLYKTFHRIKRDKFRRISKCVETLLKLVGDLPEVKEQPESVEQVVEVVADVVEPVEQVVKIVADVVEPVEQVKHVEIVPEVVEEVVHESVPEVVAEVEIVEQPEATTSTTETPKNSKNIQKIITNYQQTLANIQEHPYYDTTVDGVLKFKTMHGVYEHKRAMITAFTKNYNTYCNDVRSGKLWSEERKSGKLLADDITYLQNEYTTKLKRDYANHTTFVELYDKYKKTKTPYDKLSRQQIEQFEEVTQPDEAKQHHEASTSSSNEPKEYASIKLKPQDVEEQQLIQCCLDFGKCDKTYDGFICAFRKMYDVSKYNITKDMMDKGMSNDDVLTVIENDLEVCFIAMCDVFGDNVDGVICAFGKMVDMSKYNITEDMPNEDVFDVIEEDVKGMFDDDWDFLDILADIKGKTLAHKFVLVSDAM
jgi:hypothetical protein